MSPRYPLLLAISTALACASSPAPEPSPPLGEAEQTPAAPLAVEVAGPAWAELPSGAKVEVPAGFVGRREQQGLRLLDPEGALAVGMYELEASELDGAVVRAWSMLDGTAAPAIEQVIDPPARDGWDAIRVLNYQRDAQERFAQAVARKKGGLVWVSLLRGPSGEVDKRAAQVRSFFGSLKVPGVGDLDLSAATPTPLGERAAELDAFVEELMKLSRTPGLTLAVVEDGRVVHARGFGVRALGRKEKVDADTLMMIGSVSKSMTTLLMGSLADEGRLRWEQPVKELYPDFELGDAELARSLSVEELVCACAGLPRKDMPLILEFEGKPAKQVFAELREMKPTTGRRETFQYQNHMVAAGGFLAAHLLHPGLELGEAYAQAMQARVFGPLGMKRTTLSVAKATKDRNHALPHSLDAEGTHRPVKLAHEDFARYVGPSGGIWSSAREMAGYVLNELGRGPTPPVVTEANRKKRWAKQVTVGKDVDYGLGFLVETRRGLTHVSHGGGTMGFATLLGFYPDKGLGYVMIANGTGGHMVEATVRARLVELWFGIDDKAKEGFMVGLEAQKQGLAELRAQLTTPDAETAKRLVGVHQNPELGRFSLATKKGELWLDAGVYQTRLGLHTRPDGKQSLVFRDPPLVGLSLELEPEGSSFRLVKAQESYDFSRLR